jgi:hypothetical protein
MAIALSRSGLGTDLFESALKAGDSELILKVFLVQWRERLRNELRTNQSGYLKKRQPTLATKITDSFPDPQVVFAYVHPLTSWSNNQGGPKLPELQPPAPAIKGHCSILPKEALMGQGQSSGQIQEPSLEWGVSCHARRGMCFNYLSHMCLS